MTAAAALFVDRAGIYPTLLGAHRCWDETIDARRYPGPHPVVAHPPCARWSRLAPSVFARTGKEQHRPAWLGGTDGGCFAAALAAVRKFGGVLEHPAGSHAWAHFDLSEPVAGEWLHTVLRSGQRRNEWTCQVWQSAYGHPADKLTWLLYCGARAPFELDWRHVPGTHVVGGDSRKRARHPNPLPRLTSRENIATPEPFARMLIRLADWSRGESEAMC